MNFEIFLCAALLACLAFILNTLSGSICLKNIEKFRKEELKALKQKKAEHYLKNYVLIPVATAFFISYLIFSLCPLFELALILNIALISTFFIISYLKFNVLKESLVITDFYLIKEIILKPSFYFSYVKGYIWLILASIIVCILYMLLHIDYIYLSLSVRAVCLCLAVLLLCALYLLSKKDDLIYDALFDGGSVSVLTAFIYQIVSLIKAMSFIKKNSLSCFLQRHGLNIDLLDESVTDGKRGCSSCQDMMQRTDDDTNADNNESKNIILMQSESYCSLYRLGLDDRPSYIDSESKINLHALLDIDYLGAYTMRSEFSVLTGLDRKKLGVFAYDPYILLRKYKFPSLVSKLKAKGYSCICIHPNSKYFFSRNKVMQNLGFDLFISKEMMTDEIATKTMGSDYALSDFILSILKGQEIFDESLSFDIKDKIAKGRLFIFVITMASHGPYTLKEHKKRVSRGDDISKLKGLKATEPLSIYKTKQLDFNNGTEHLIANLDSNTSLIVYGDHLPSVSAVLASYGQLKPDIFAYNIKPLDESTLKDADKSTKYSCSEKTDNKDLNFRTNSSQNLMSAYLLHLLTLKQGGI